MRLITLTPRWASHQPAPAIKGIPQKIAKFTSPEGAIKLSTSQRVCDHTEPVINILDRPVSNSHQRGCVITQNHRRGLFARPLPDGPAPDGPVIKLTLDGAFKLKSERPCDQTHTRERDPVITLTGPAIKLTRGL